MGYHAILLFNAKSDIQGVFTIRTTEGNVVVLSEMGPRLAEFLDLAAEMAKASGEKVGYTDLKAPTFQGAVQRLLEMDPSMAGEAIFVDQYR